MPTTNIVINRPRFDRVTPLRLALAGLLAAAGGLHLAALPSHLAESTAAGAFFAAAALGQLLGAVLVAVRPSRRTAVAIIAGNLSVLAIWALSRTTGLPIDGAIGAREPVSLLDGLAAAAEILVVTGGLASVIRPSTAGVRRSGAWMLALGLAGIWLVSGALATDWPYHTITTTMRAGPAPRQHPR